MTNEKTFSKYFVPRPSFYGIGAKGEEIFQGFCVSYKVLKVNKRQVDLLLHAFYLSCKNRS